MADIDFQNFSTVQSNLQPQPVTVAASTTLAPTTFMTFITGTTAVNQITPPVSGSHMLLLVFTATNAGTFGTTGNLVTTAVTNPSQVANGIIAAVFNPIDARYYLGRWT